MKILSGGQSLLPLMKMRLSKPGFVVDIGRIPDLDRISEEGDNLILGALVTHAQIEHSELLKNKCPLLPQTATTIADVQVRNRGTIGGSVAHADPAGDWPATALALDAEVKIVGPNGERWIKCSEFFLGLLMSVLERQHEIGVMKAVGARSAQVLALFLVEGGIIGGAGAAVGLLGAWLVSFPGDRIASHLVATKTPMQLDQSVFAFPLWLVVGVPLAVCALTTLAGLYPARRAASIDPIEALRHE